MSRHFLGMISGTSCDGVDCVIARISDETFEFVHARTFPYPPPLRQRVTDLIGNSATTLETIGRLDTALGRFFADCALEAVRSAGLQPQDIEATGHHGQTVFHAPDDDEAFTMQLADPNTVAARTGIVTVADLRRLDMALGGQGAPLVCAFHDWRFRDRRQARAVVNIGGIANVTLLEPGHPTIGFDTGPGNTLLDGWIGRCRGETFDARGKWASGGSVSQELLDACLNERYFQTRPPKSTGRELFNMHWLDSRLVARGTANDPSVQATLSELTAISISSAIETNMKHCERIFICGGGAHNDDLLQRIQRIAGVPVDTTASLGVDPDWVEGAAFAWLAWARLQHRPGNVPTVTGARGPAVLGSVYCPAVSNPPLTTRDDA